MKLFILAGIPGCGKSTWASTMMPNVTRISTDEIRRELHTTLKEAHKQDANESVFGTFYGRIGDHLRHEDVVADATALTKDSRIKLVQIAKLAKAEVHLVIFMNTAQALIRNKKRSEDTVVPEDVMNKKMFPNFQATVESLKQGERNQYDSVTYIASVS